MATDVIVTFSEPIASVPTAGITITGVGTLDNARFSFPYLGDVTKCRVGITSTSVTGISFAGIVDVNESATASPSASLSTALPLAGIQYGSTTNYAYASNLITDTGSWTWQFWANLPQGAGYAIGSHFAGLEWHDASNNDWYLEPGSNPNNMGYKITIGSANRITYNGPRRITITRNGTTFTIHTDGLAVGSKAVSGYTFGTQFRTNVGFYNTANVYPSNGRMWDVTIWDSVRSAAQIAANDLTGAAHHYSLDNTLADSVGGVDLTAAGAPTYVASFYGLKHRYRRRVCETLAR